MSVPSAIFAEIYNLLCSYNEIPKISKEIFIGWYANNYIYTISIELQSLIFICSKPFLCHVIRNDEMLPFISDEKFIKLNYPFISNENFIKLNEELNLLSSRVHKIKAFW